ncbi:MAG: hypothetical protein N3G20_05445 [Verrucomicrobiae bacterium]|nr:hypothetical protein [Verrucomicrobiae bacterium]
MHCSSTTLRGLVGVFHCFHVFCSGMIWVTSGQGRNEDRQAFVTASVPDLCPGVEEAVNVVPGMAAFGDSVEVDLCVLLHYSTDVWS